MIFPITTVTCEYEYILCFDQYIWIRRNDKTELYFRGLGILGFQTSNIHHA